MVALKVFQRVGDSTVQATSPGGYRLTSLISNPRNWARGSGYRSLFIILVLSLGLLILLSIRGVVVMEDLVALSSSPTSRQARNTGK